VGYGWLVQSVSRRGLGSWLGAAGRWAARHPNALLVAGAAIAALAMPFVSNALPRPLHPGEGFEEDLARFDPPAKRAVERALMWRLIFPGDYDARVEDHGATYEVWLRTIGCSNYRGSHPGCKLYIARLPKDTLEVTITDESGGK
jgi:hypothetical protein